MRLLADEQAGHLLLPPFAVEGELRTFHFDPRRPSSSNPVISADRSMVMVLEIDASMPSSFQKEPVHNPLLNVFDVDAAFGQVCRKLRNNALLVLPQHADDSQYGLSQNNLLRIAV